MSNDQWKFPREKAWEALLYPGGSFLEARGEGSSEVIETRTALFQNVGDCTWIGVILPGLSKKSIWCCSALQLRPSQARAQVNVPC